MERNKIIVIFLLVIFLAFSFRIGFKVMGLNILNAVRTEGSEGIGTQPRPQMQVLNTPIGTGEWPARVGTVSINPGVVTTVEIER